jgi:sortase A
MAEQDDRKIGLSSLTRFEQLALLSSILVWTGAIAFGIGLTIALYNLRSAQVAYAKVKVKAIATFETATLSPLSTTQLYPAGWSTATATPSLDPTREPEPAETLATQEPSRTPSPVPTETRTPSRHPPDRLVIPSIELDSPIVPIGWTTVEQNGTTARVWNVVDQVVGWHKTSERPGGVGNVVLNGHHNIKGEVFRTLVDVQEGDSAIVYAQDEVYYYEVTEKHILKEKGEPVHVRQENARWIAATKDERLTMITCWPYTNNTHRLVVVAKPVPAPELEVPDRSEEP